MGISERVAVLEEKVAVLEGRVEELCDCAEIIDERVFELEYHVHPHEIGVKCIAKDELVLHDNVCPFHHP